MRHFHSCVRSWLSEWVSENWYNGCIIQQTTCDHCWSVHENTWVYLMDASSAPVIVWRIRRKTRMLAINVPISNLTVAVPTWRSSDHRNCETREKTNKRRDWKLAIPYTKSHIVISHHRPHTASVVPKTVAMATSIRTSISAMSSSDSCRCMP